MDAVPLNDETALIHRCEWEDLAVVTTVPGAVQNAEYFDLMNEMDRSARRRIGTLLRLSV